MCVILLFRFPLISNTTITKWSEAPGCLLQTPQQLEQWVQTGNLCGFQSCAMPCLHSPCTSSSHWHPPFQGVVNKCRICQSNHLYILIKCHIWGEHEGDSFSRCKRDFYVWILCPRHTRILQSLETAKSSCTRSWGLSMKSTQLDKYHARPCSIGCWNHWLLFLSRCLHMLPPASNLGSWFGCLFLSDTYKVEIGLLV